ncbi:MAG: glycosyltransferase family 2 protein [Saprospiraceae bacterium]|nr:glycosyltransferase family 2 protein [Saprospiraceae bacterium]
MFDVPVALMIYNRPELTRQVFAQIRLLQPRQLFIIADGPKDETDDRNCRQARQVVADVDWDCEIQTLYSPHNLGVAKCPSNGLKWVFDQVDRCIILEDDTLPELSFFEFCRLLLQKYEEDESVMSISGANLCGVIQTEYSYGFSRFSLPPWGWATWRRAWQYYDFRMDDWMEQKSRLKPAFGTTFPFWEMILERYSKKLTSWDIQWNYAIWKKNGRVIIPRQNMIRNLGYGEGASFTTVDQSFTTHLPVTPCSFPLVHPAEKNPDFNAYLEPKVIEFLEEIIRFNSRKDAVGL